MATTMTTEIDAKYDSIAARAQRGGHQLLVTREEYRQFARHGAWLQYGEDDMRRMQRSFGEDLTDDDAANPRLALLNWMGRAPNAGDEVLTIHVDTTTFAPAKGEKVNPNDPPCHVTYLRRWKFLRVVGGVGVSVSDTDDVDDVDTAKPVGIRRLLCEKIG